MSTFEGYLEINHKESPGFTEQEALVSGMPFVQKGQKFQAATNTCSHCDQIVIQNPNRTRVRGHCSKCDRFICDSCQADMYLGGACRCYEIRIENLLENINGP